MNAINSLHKSARKSPWRSLFLCLFAAAASAFLLLETAWAQEGQESGYVDLIMHYELAPEHYEEEVRYTVRNNGTATAVGVTVSFLLEDLEVGDFADSDTPPAGIADIRTEDGTNQRLTWEVGDIPPGGTSGSITFQTKLHSGRLSEIVNSLTWPGRIGVINATASSLSPEPGMLLANNSIKVYAFAAWSHRTYHMGHSRLALLLSVDDLRPKAGDGVNFGLTAQNRNRGQVLTSDYINLIGDINIRVELSAGLEFEEGWSPPAEFVKSGQSATWRPEAVDAKANHPQNAALQRPSNRVIEIQTQLTSASLADIPLEERCITARVTSSTPPPSADYPLNSLTQCLGDDPPLLFEQGTLQAFTPYPCVDASGTAITSYPCVDSDGNRVSTSDIAVVAVAHSSGFDPDPRLQGVGRSTQGKVVLLPDRGIYVQVKDPSARVVTGSAVTWHTGRKTTGKTVPGVKVDYSPREFTDTTSGKECPGTTTCRWTNLARTVNVKGLTPGSRPPSGVKIKLDSSGEFQHFDANSGNSYTHTRATWDLAQYVSRVSMLG